MSFSGQAADMPLTDGVTGRRVLAWIVDATIVGVALCLLQTVLWLLGFLTLGLGWFLINGLWVLPLIYTSGFVVSDLQATPGQALLGLMVVRDADLGRPTPVQALAYAAGFALTMWAGAIWLVAAFFTRRARCLHDIVAGVAVVRAGNVPGATIWRPAGRRFGP
jgi:uncharacterized RDD family membrane protein YckC